MLSSLRRILYSRREDWDMYFESDWREALNLLARQPFDVLISEVFENGEQTEGFLGTVKKKYPGMARIILSGKTGYDISLRAARLAHQFLSKPCSPEELTLAVSNATALNLALENRELKKTVAGMQSLPSMPTLYLDIVEELKKKNVSPERIGKIISQDMAMTAKVLQLVNSAFFALPRQVSDPAQAVMLLGIETIRDLVLSISLFSYIDKVTMARLGLTTLWNHSMQVATLSRRVMSQMKGSKEMCGYSFIAGLLHDVGMLILGYNYPSQSYSSFILSVTRNMERWEAERQIFGVDHAQLGAYLFSLWGFPEPVITAVAFHHHPNLFAGSKKTPLTAVHIANVLDHNYHGIQAYGFKTPDFSPGVLDAAGIDLKALEAV